MAKARPQKKAATTGARSGRAMWIGLIVVALVAAVGWAYREPAMGYANTATAYSARVACSCRFVAGRSLKDCKKDRLAGMELVTLVDDPQAKSVTARFPLISSDTAIFRKGYGCVLQKWDG